MKTSKVKFLVVVIVAVAAELVTPAFSGPTQAAQQSAIASSGQAQAASTSNLFVKHN